MSNVSHNDISRHLHHNTSLQFVGDGQTLAVNDAANNTTFLMDGNPQSPYLWPTAHLVVSNPQTFHGTVDMGPATDVSFSTWASSFSYDAAHDILSLYQGDKVVDTVHVRFHGGASLASVQSSAGAGAGSGWTDIATGYHGLAYGISPHVGAAV